MESESAVFWPDLIILGILLISIAISFIRGFIKEVISLVSWVFAAWVAFLLANPLSNWITFTDIESLRALIAFMVVFVSLVFLGAVVNFIVGKFIRRTPFSLPDRMLGMGFGLLRGVLIVTLLIFFAGLTPITQDAWWNRSFAVNQFEGAAIWLKERLPENIGKHFVFESPEPSAQA